MITPDGKHCTVKGIVVWDGITRPETDTPVGKPKHSCKIVVHPQEPGLVDFGQIATNELNTSPFQGQLPQGANWAVGEVQANDAFNKDGRFNGYLCINAGTYQGAPQVFDVNGREMQPMEYGNLLYAGCTVDLLLSAYHYDNKQKGIAAGLAGLMIIDSTSERLNVGAAGIDASTVFGAAPSTGMPAQGQGATPMPSNMPGNAPMPNQGVQNVPGQVVAGPATGQPPGVPGASSVPVANGNVQPNTNYLP